MSAIRCTGHSELSMVNVADEDVRVAGEMLKRYQLQSYLLDGIYLES